MILEGCNTYQVLFEQAHQEACIRQGLCQKLQDCGVGLKVFKGGGHIKQHSKVELPNTFA